MLVCIPLSHTAAACGAGITHNTLSFLPPPQYADTFKPVRPGALPRQGKAISKKPAEDAPPVPKFTHKTTKQVRGTGFN